MPYMSIGITVRWSIPPHWSPAVFALNGHQAKLPSLVGDAPSAAGSRLGALPDTGKRERSTAEVDDARQRYLQRKMQRKR